MSDIKTPQEYFLEYFADGKGTLFDFAQAYHEYAMEQKIEESEENWDSISCYGLPAIIEILNK